MKMSAVDGRTYDKNGRLLVPWKDPNGRTIFLLTQEEFNQLPDGTLLGIINGQTVTKGIDYIDDDTRAGRLAYGLLEEPE